MLVAEFRFFFFLDFDFGCDGAGVSVVCEL